MDYHMRPTTITKAYQVFDLKPGEYAEISPQMARCIAEKCGFDKLPRIGYEILLNKTWGIWLSNQAGQYEVQRSMAIGYCS